MVTSFSFLLKWSVFFAVTLQESIFYVVYMFIFLLYFLRASTQEDFPQQRRPLQHDEHRSSLQRDGLSRPSGRYIYSMTKKKNYFRRKCKITNLTFGRLSKWKCVFVTVQRKDYSENLNRQAESLHVRVEVSQESVFKIRQTSDYSSLMTINACPAAPVHLWAGRPGAEENWRLCGQAEEAGSQRSSVATGDDHGGHGRTPAAEWHRVQGRDNEDSFVFLNALIRW